MMDYASFSIQYNSPPHILHSLPPTAARMAAPYSSTYAELVADLTRDVQRAQPRDVLQYCANWFNSRLQEQRTRIRDAFQAQAFGRPSAAAGLTDELFVDRAVPARGSVPNGSMSISSSVRSSPMPSHSQPHPQAILSLPSPIHRLLLSLRFTSTRHSPIHLLSRAEVHSRWFLVLVSQTPLHLAHLLAPALVNVQSLHRVTTLSMRKKSPRRLALLLPPLQLVLPHSSLLLPVHSAVELAYPKSTEQLQRIKASIANAFLFRNLDTEQEKAVLGAMQERHVSAGERVIEQGADDNEGGVGDEVHPTYGRKVLTYTTGGTFGELALMYNAPRAATIVAIEPSTLWALDRMSFRSIILSVANRKRKMYERFLATVPLLETLDASERSRIADVLEPRTYNEGDSVWRKRVKGEDGELRDDVVMKYGPGDFFGELALLHRAPRAATVRASVTGDNNGEPNKLKVAVLDAKRSPVFSEPQVFA
ncbi:cAMP-dependent protein kinase inhibitor [Rhizoctonia solani]|uniref:cAMP-dependent protein kinase regulatory subunit n=1 Tax=Rhizoctonia solani TaxID=456999 RepID=A0A8H8NXR4_9AGAM|nr:cAMP-dependent protein kinase inhibitor [Rhizoctonia solani]QRW20286.1 cAMP-dependent protein kinase inhibitor [Rhizoctonia solani]